MDPSGRSAKGQSLTGLIAHICRAIRFAIAVLRQVDHVSHDRAERQLQVSPLKAPETRDFFLGREASQRQETTRGESTRQARPPGLRLEEWGVEFRSLLT